jgi:hypothetical protein
MEEGEECIHGPLYQNGTVLYQDAEECSMGFPPAEAAGSLAEVATLVLLLPFVINVAFE